MAVATTELSRSSQHLIDSRLDTIDRMLLGRMFSYPDTHRYRIGANYLQLPINRPRSEVHSYNKDGAMRHEHNGGAPVYAPNSYGGPRADPERLIEPSWDATGEIVRTAQTLHSEDDDYGQPGTLYREVLSQTDRTNLTSNLVDHLSDGVEREVQARAVEGWYKVDPELGSNLAAGLGLSGVEANGASATIKAARA